MWFPLSRLVKQFQWAGAALVDTGFLVCPNKCLDVPQDQNRVLILPPDPVPRVNPRPSHDVTPPAPSVTPANMGFSQYVLGAPIAGDYPTLKPDVLARVAKISGIPTPGGIVDRSKSVTATNTTLALMNANPARSWLLLYNPNYPQLQISLSAACPWGFITNLILGPGEAYFWATSQNFAPTYTGQITFCGLTPTMSVFAWESP